MCGKSQLTISLLPIADKALIMRCEALRLPQNSLSPLQAVATNCRVQRADSKPCHKQRKARNLIDEIPRYGMERETGLEPAALCLGSRSSTTELLPRRVRKYTTGFAACQCE